MLKFKRKFRRLKVKPISISPSVLSVQSDVPLTFTTHLRSYTDPPLMLAHLHKLVWTPVSKITSVMNISLCCCSLKMCSPAVWSGDATRGQRAVKSPWTLHYSHPRYQGKLYSVIGNNNRYLRLRIAEDRRDIHHCHIQFTFTGI